MINRVVNQRYEVVEKVGESPIFAVYKARDRVSSRIVALKAVQPSFVTDASFLTALKNGLNSSAKLNHPNITRFQEWGEDDDLVYVIVEFVRGINLKERIRRIAPFSLSVAVDFACAIGEAIHYAHSAGMAHGDLRPQNIVISPEGAVKVTDFGLQPAMARSTPAQQETLQRAAPYRAPELSPTQPGTVGGDIYALGAILYEMLTGTPPYSGDTPEAIADQHASSNIPSPRLINPGVPRSVEGIILKCLQKRPEDRYRNAAELLNDLKSVRDALRFGKPLSWSPIDLDKQAAPPRAAALESRTPGAVLDPIADVAASSQALPMPKNRLRAQSERVSFFIKTLIVLMTFVIVIVTIGFFALYASLWVVPKPVPVPQLVGKPIDEVRDIAKGMKVNLIERADYSERPRNIVYKTYPAFGAQTRQNHVLTVWYSRGPEYVNVPDMTGLPKEEAEKRLKDAGLILGKVMPEYSSKVPINNVIGQNVSSKKRVFHDTAVDLVVSDGPKPDYAEPTPPTSDQTPDNSATPPADSTDANATPNPPTELPSQDSTKNFDRTISIPFDHLGRRRVRIEYRDSLGTPIAVIDEEHGEGDKIPVSFVYSGKNITLTIYYDDKKVFERTFDPQATKKDVIR